MILPQVRTTFAARAKNFGTIASLIAEMSDAQGGNVLVLFPSYEFLQQVAGKMQGSTLRCTGKYSARTFVERERERRFSKHWHPRRATESRAFRRVGRNVSAEGVDYPGELLTGVYVVSPALPKVSFERELLRRYFDETEQAGFEYAYLQPGMTRVIQAAGRLIRSETDRGVIALLCQRFLQEPYVSRLPRDWYGESPLELMTRSPVKEIHEFFKRANGIVN